MKYKTIDDVQDAIRKGEVIEGDICAQYFIQQRKVTGRYYYFECDNEMLMEKYFPADAFDSIMEARDIAADHEAVLTEHRFVNGEQVGKVIEHTLYVSQGFETYEGDRFAADLVISYVLRKIVEFFAAPIYRAVRVLS